jgi:hypothetical protein
VSQDRLRKLTGDAVALERELRAVARRGVPHAYQWYRGKPPLPIPVLDRIVRALALSFGQSSPDLALVRVVEAALTELPDDAVQPYNREPQYITWRSMGELLFGEVPSDEAAETWHYDARFKQQVGVPEDADDATLGRRASKLREKLALILLDMESRGRSVDAAIRTKSKVLSRSSIGVPTRLVPRPSLIAQWNAATLDARQLLDSYLKQYEC